MSTSKVWLAGLALIAFGPLVSVAVAAPIANRVAVLEGLDKITARITRFDVYIGETVLFGALEITPRACYNHPPTEVQRTSAFIEVDQRSLQNSSKRIFTGWIFADSPALNAIDHAVYDVWLIECKNISDVPPPDKRDEELPGGAQPAVTPDAPADGTAAPALATP